MENHSLSHTRWECLYHIVWIPKYRRKRLYGDLRRELGEILAALVEQMDGVEKVEGSACVDHIHICLRIAPKHAVSSVVGKLKGRLGHRAVRQAPRAAQGHGQGPHPVGQGVLREHRRPGRGGGQEVHTEPGGGERDRVGGRPPAGA